jgi:hypothetical protein
VWDLEHGRPRDITRGDGPVLAVSVSAAGFRGAVGSASGLELVDLSQRRVAARRSCETGLGGGFAEDAALAISADGSGVYHGCPPRIWVADRDELLPPAVGDARRVLAVSSGGRAVCAPRSGDLGGLVVCELEGMGAPASSRRTRRRSRSGLSRRTTVGRLRRFRPPGDRLAAGCARSPAAGERASITCLASASTTEHAVSASVDSEVKAWSLADGTEADAPSSIRAAMPHWAHQEALDAELLGRRR